MTLRQLSYFVTASRFGNLSKAAEQFGVSQPSVSTAIKHLEEEFGVELIQRSKAGFLLTEDGERFCEMAKALLQHAQSVSRAMTAKGEKKSVLRLGVPPMIASLFFLSVYETFQKECPTVDLVTQEMGRIDLIEALDNKLLDMAFLPHDTAFPSSYESRKIMDTETVFCVLKTHPLASRKSVRAEDLKDEKLVLFDTGFFHTERIYRLFSDIGCEPKVIHTSSQLSTVERFVTSGLAAGFLFRDLAKNNRELVPISLSPKMNTSISLVYRKDFALNQAAKAFLDCLEKL